MLLLILVFDPAFGSSSYAWVIFQIRHSYLECIFANEESRPNFDEAISKTLYLYNWNNCRAILIDSSAPAVISAIKTALQERKDYLTQIDELKSQWNVNPKEPTELVRYGMRCIPVGFGAGESAVMLNTAQVFMSAGGIAIHPSFSKLIYALRTATIKPETGALNKAETQYDDTLDAFRICLKAFKAETKSK